MKTFLKVVGILVVIAVAVIAILIFLVGNAANLTEYKLGGDKVASVNAVIGEVRKTTGVSSGTSGGVRYKQYTYETASMFEDLKTYSVFLQNNDWLVTQSYDLSAGTGEAQFGKQSVDKGKILLLSIAFAPDKYTVRINKLDGELTLK